VEYRAERGEAMTERTVGLCWRLSTVRCFNSLLLRAPEFEPKKKKKLVKNNRAITVKALDGEMRAILFDLNECRYAVRHGVSSNQKEMSNGNGRHNIITRSNDVGAPPFKHQSV
jgi:hypothetical protein